MKAVIFAAVLVAYVTGDCGVSSVQPNIDLNTIQITPAKPNSWPWHVLLNAFTFNFIPLCDSSCTGALISENWVVTTATCASDSTALYYVTLGATILGYPFHLFDCPRNPLETQRQEIDVDKVYIHPNFVESDKNRAYDVALLRLKQPAQLNTFANPVCLPEADENLHDGTHVVRTGWGFRTDIDRYQRLRQMVIPFIEQSACRQSYASTSFNVDDSMICAGMLPQDDPGQEPGYCKGYENGDPLVLQENGKWVLQGIGSWAKNCSDTQYPAVYSRIAKPDILSFIKGITGIN